MADLWSDIPPVCTDPDLSRIISVPLRTIQKRRKARTWPIPTLPKIDRHNRTSRKDVIS